MKHVICPVLVTTISPVMRASAAQTDGFFRWDDVLLAPDHSRPALHLFDIPPSAFPSLVYSVIPPPPPSYIPPVAQDGALFESCTGADSH